MHATERDQVILNLLDERGFVSFQELTRRLDASPATLRRDLDRLQVDGKLVHIARRLGCPASKVVRGYGTTTGFRELLAFCGRTPGNVLPAHDGSNRSVDQ